MLQELKYINTLAGPILKEDFQQKDIKFLPHEHLFHDLSRQINNCEVSNSLNYIKKNILISLQTLDQIRMNPMSSLQNIVLNNVAEIQHELQQLTQSIAIIETTNKNQGQDFEKLLKLTNVIIIVGLSNDLISEKQSTEENRLLYSKENIKKQISFEINLGQNGIKHAFIGEIELDLLNLDSWIVKNYLEVYFEISEQVGIPIFINLNQQIEKFNQLSLNGKEKIVLINPPLEIKKIYNAAEKQEIRQLVNWEQICGLVKDNTYLIFDLLRYNGDTLKEQVILQLRKIFPKKIMISSGVMYKTDLTIYGGQGYGFWKGEEKEIILELLSWTTQSKILEEKRFWRCPVCSKDFDEKFERFKKFEKEFCSMKCLRAGIVK